MNNTQVVVTPGETAPEMPAADTLLPRQLASAAIDVCIGRRRLDPGKLNTPKLETLVAWVAPDGLDDDALKEFRAELEADIRFVRTSPTAGRYTFASPRTVARGKGDFPPHVTHRILHRLGELASSAESRLNATPLGKTGIVTSQHLVTAITECGVSTTWASATIAHIENRAYDGILSLRRGFLLPGQFETAEPHTDFASSEEFGQAIEHVLSRMQAEEVQSFRPKTFHYCAAEAGFMLAEEDLERVFNSLFTNPRLQFQPTTSTFRFADDLMPSQTFRMALPRNS